MLIYWLIFDDVLLVSNSLGVFKFIGIYCGVYIYKVEFMNNMGKIFVLFLL